MIWVWFKQFAIILLKLLWVPTQQQLRTKIDPKIPCPACGNVGSTFKFERVITDGVSFTVSKCKSCGSTAMAKIGSIVKCNQCGLQVGGASSAISAMVRVECDKCHCAHYQEPISVPRFPAV